MGTKQKMSNTTKRRTSMRKSKVSFGKPGTRSTSVSTSGVYQRTAAAGVDKKSRK